MNAKTNDRGKGVFSRTVLSTAVASALMIAAGPSAAQDEDVLALTRPLNEIELGIGYVSEDSFKFGDYSGLNEKGAYLIGNFSLVGRPAPLSGSARYWSLEGTNLGLRSRNLRYQYSNQGNYRFSFEYDELPKFRTESAQTIYNGVGTNNLTLPAGWTPAGNVTTQAAQIAAAERPYEVKHERKNYIFGFSKVLSSQWDLDVKFRRETKEGVKVVGAVIGNSGGNPRAVLIPEPTDYQTDIAEAVFNYTTQKMQFQFGYNLSLFNNDNNGLSWQSPYVGVGGWAAGSGYPYGGQLGLPPDNQFHQLTASGGYNLSNSTRLTGTLELGRLTQNQSFLPYTSNPTLAASITTPLPRASLGGQIDTTLLNLAFTARPMPKLNLRASYRYDDRDNRTPQAQYIYIGGDSQTQSATLASDRARTNLPVSSTQQLLKLDADYALMRSTKLNVGYDNDQIKHTFSEVERTTENTYRVGLRRSFSETVNGAISYAHSSRKNNGYGDEPYLESYSSQYQAGINPALNWDDNPLLRKFIYADRKRDKLRVSLNTSPSDRTTAQFRADYNDDKYDNSRLGLTGAKSQSYTVDGSYQPKEYLNLYAFYTFDVYKSDQNGRSFSGNAGLPCGKTAAPVPNVNVVGAGSSVCDWSMTGEDKFDTIGVGFKATTLRGGRLELGGDFTYSHGRGTQDMIAGTGAQAGGALPMPDLISRTDTLTLHGTYKLQKNSSVRVVLVHQKVKTSDWAWDNIGTTDVANVLTTGQLSPNYSINVVGVSYRYKFQ